VQVEEKLQNVTVPLTLVVLTMIAYLMFGATLFSVWEGWNLLEGLYFCWISLSTIGACVLNGVPRHHRLRRPIPRCGRQRRQRVAGAIGELEEEQLACGAVSVSCGIHPVIAAYTL